MASTQTGVGLAEVEPVIIQRPVHGSTRPGPSHRRARLQGPGRPHADVPVHSLEQVCGWGEERKGRWVGRQDLYKRLPTANRRGDACYAATVEEKALVGESDGRRSGDERPDGGEVGVEMDVAWPDTVAEAEAVQDRLRPLVDLVGPGPIEPRTIAGLDVAYAEDGDRLAAAVTVLDARTLAVVETAVTVGRAAFPYVPGLFAFRELPRVAGRARPPRRHP